MAEIVIVLVIIACFIVFWVILWLVSSGGEKGRRKPPPTRMSAPSQRSTKISTTTKRVTKTTQIRQVLEQGYTKRQRVTMEYETGNPLPGEPARKIRDIDTYGLGNEYFEAFCHYRNGVRTFKMSQVLWARLTSEAYQIPATYVPNDWVRYGWGKVQGTELEPMPEEPLAAGSILPTSESTELEGRSQPIALPGRHEERTKSYVRHDWQRRFEESILSPFPEDLSPALPYLREAHRLEEEGADQAKIEQVLAKARQADSDATTFYLTRWSIIKKLRHSRSKDQGNVLPE